MNVRFKIISLLDAWPGDIPAYHANIGFSTEEAGQTYINRELRHLGNNHPWKVIPYECA